MRIIYLKTKKTKPFFNPYLWKVVEIDKETVSIIQVTENSIEIDESEDLFEQVSFIKNKLCSDEGCEEIDKKEFNEFYKKTLEKIKLISSK